jgi:hypothetical protein
MSEQIEMFGEDDVRDDTFLMTNPALRRVVTIRHNKECNDDTVEVLDGTRQLGMYTDSELDPFKLAEILRWFGHTVRVVEYMFEHDIAEFG